MKIVIGNLKMNLNSPKERERYLSLLKKELTGQKLINTELILLPSFIHLEAFRRGSQRIPADRWIAYSPSGCRFQW